MGRRNSRRPFLIEKLLITDLADKGKGFGKDEEGNDMVYIGEGENCWERIKDHHRKKDFWTDCIIAGTKTNDYNKADAKYLEHHCLKIAEQIGRYKFENYKASSIPSITESRESDLLDNFETAKILLTTLGYPIFEDKRQGAKKEVYYCKGKDASAQGILTNEGFLIYKGGRCTMQETKSIDSWISRLRAQLIKDSILIEEKGQYVFQSDYLFNSLSAAATTVLARAANGWTSWKDKNGKTLDELKRQN